MSRKTLTALLSVTLILSGCATTGGGSDRAICVAIGGILGGRGGGSIYTSWEHGTVFGATIGALLGYHLCAEPRVNQPPSARISADPTGGEAPLEVAFRGDATDSDGQIAGYAWDFGDGASATEQYVSHRFDAPGAYGVRLTVTDNDGETQSAEITITVTPRPAAAPPPREATPTPQIVLRGVRFDFDSSAISAESAEILAEAVRAFSDNPAMRIEIVGHTDSTGPEAYNQGLSERRAQGVLEHLAAAGIGRERFNAVGYGERQPLADNTTREGRTRNRRVELNPR